jgi:hypothetical protein
VRLTRFALPRPFCGGRIDFLPLPDPGLCLPTGARICGRSSSWVFGSALQHSASTIFAAAFTREAYIRTAPKAQDGETTHSVLQHIALSGASIPAISRTKPGLEVTDARTPTGPHIPSTGASQPVPTR